MRANATREVELVGLPGAGKTTLADDVVRRLRDAGLAVIDRDHVRARVSAHHAARSRPRRWLSYLAHQLRRPGVARRTLELAAGLRPRNVDGFRRGFHLTRLAHNDAIRRALTRAPSWLVWDQGIVQEIWAVLYLRTQPREATLRRLLGALAPHLPDVLVHVRVDGATALERMRERNRRVGPLGEIDAMEATLTPRLLDDSVAELDRIGALVAETGREVITLDGAGSTEHNTAALLRSLGLPDLVRDDEVRSDDVTGR